MEMTMRRKLLTVLAVPLIAALTAQAAAASEHHHTRTKGRAVVSEQFRNSNAYAAPDDVAVQSEMPDYAEGAMTSGPAGH
jgi:predicted lipoprotein